MNERIKELAVQADLLIKKSNGDEFRYGNSDPRFQKFAELIVKECAKKTIQGLMSDPAFVQAMDEYYENKWAHRFD